MREELSLLRKWRWISFLVSREAFLRSRILGRFPFLRSHTIHMADCWRLLVPCLMIIKGAGWNFYGIVYDEYLRTKEPCKSYISYIISMKDVHLFPDADPEKYWRWEVMRSCRCVLGCHSQEPSGVNFYKRCRGCCPITSCWHVRWIKIDKTFCKSAATWDRVSSWSTIGYADGGRLREFCLR